MTRDEIKLNIDGKSDQIINLEQIETQLYTELGRKVLPELPEDAYPELVEQIKTNEIILNGLRNEKSFLEEEYQKIIAASTCFYCNAINAEGSVFCEECGKRLGEKPKEYCETCGTINHPGQKFCGECGARLPE